MVCKLFYQGTLGISQKIIYNVLGGREPNTGIPNNNKSMTSNACKMISDEKNVRQHIESFPLIDSYYCRAKTNKQGTLLQIHFQH